MDAVARATDRARIVDIEAEIQKLKRSIREFRSEQAIIQARLESYRYPVLTLPNELVSEIFLHFLPIYPSCPPLTGGLSPNNLLQICRKWREIALATAALWRAVLLSFMHDEKKQAPAVQAWLSRSGCYPLSIEAHQEMDIEGELLDTIAAHCVRWEHVKLQLTLSDLPVDSSLPMLRQLELQIPFKSSHPVLGALPELPLLREATLWDFPYSSDLLPWSQLTSLILIARPPEDCTPILQQAVNLVHCELIIDDERGLPQPDIHLPRLETLIFGLYLADDEAAPNYLDSFVVPALRRLQLSEKFLTMDPIDALASFCCSVGLDSTILASLIL
ncbi:hypothetical protein DFH06DRAFT_1406377 [Mycena polygramma]|nr:hypothetical protein DFH06DRAFT_1406377 [Mycena polygramma]